MCWPRLARTSEGSLCGRCACRTRYCRIMRHRQHSTSGLLMQQCSLATTFMSARHAPTTSSELCGFYWHARWAVNYERSVDDVGTQVLGMNCSM